MVVFVTFCYLEPPPEVVSVAVVIHQFFVWFNVPCGKKAQPRKFVTEYQLHFAVVFLATFTGIIYHLRYMALCILSINAEKKHAKILI